MGEAVRPCADAGSVSLAIRPQVNAPWPFAFSVSPW